MSSVTSDELDIDYHRQQHAAFINCPNAEAAAYFTNEALNRTSLFDLLHPIEKTRITP